MDTLNGMLHSFGAFLQSALPQSPFTEFFEDWVPPEGLGWLNWLFPCSACVTLFEAWLVAVGLYMLYSVLMRWVRVIG